MATAVQFNPITAMAAHFEVARRPAYIKRVKSPLQLVQEAAADYAAAFGDDPLNEVDEHLQLLDAAAKDAARFWQHFAHISVEFLTDAVDHGFDHLVGDAMAAQAHAYFKASVAYELSLLASKKEAA